MQSWIRTDVDFGVSGARLAVNLRTEVGQALLKSLQEAGDDPVQMAKVCQEVVERVRLDLKGCRVIGMRSGRYPTMLTIDVLHPSLPKVGCNELWPEQMLEPCPVCKRGIPADGTSWVSYDPEVKLLVCSAVCANARRTHEQNVAEVMKRCQSDNEHDVWCELDAGHACPHEALGEKHVIRWPNLEDDSSKPNITVIG